MRILERYVIGIDRVYELFVHRVVGVIGERLIFHKVVVGKARFSEVVGLVRFHIFDVLFAERADGRIVHHVQELVLRIVAELGEQHVGQRGLTVENDHDFVLFCGDFAG